MSSTSCGFCMLCLVDRPSPSTRSSAGWQASSSARTVGLSEETLVPVYTEDTPPTDFEGCPRGATALDRQMQLYAALVDQRVVGRCRVAELNIFDFCARFSYSVQMHHFSADVDLDAAMAAETFEPACRACRPHARRSVPRDPGRSRHPRRPLHHYDFASDKTFELHQNRTTEEEEEAAGFGSMRAMRCAAYVARQRSRWRGRPRALKKRGGRRRSSVPFARLEVQTGALDAGKVREHAQATTSTRTRRRTCRSSRCFRVGSRRIGRYSARTARRDFS